MNPYPLLLLVVLFAASAGVVSEAHAQITQADSLAIDHNSFRQNLIHLGGNYYVSAGYSATNADNNNIAEHQLVLRLYTIINGDITLVRSQNLDDAQGVLSALEENSNPTLHTSLARINDDSIALAYLTGGGYTVERFTVRPTLNPSFLDASTTDALIQAGNRYFPSLIKLSDSQLALAHTTGPGGPYQGRLTLITIESTGGGLRLPTGHTTNLPNNQYSYNSMAKIDDNTVALSYRGGGADGTLLGINITPGTTTVSVGTPDKYTETSDRTSYHSLVRVDDDTLAVAYSHFGATDNDKTGGRGDIRLFDLNDRTFTQVDTITYYDGGANRRIAEHAHFNSLVLLDSDTLAVAYRGEDADGFIRLYNIIGSGSTATLQAIGTTPFEHDTNDGSFNKLLRVDDTTLALIYSGDYPNNLRDTTTIPSTIKTFSVAVPSGPTTPTVTSVAASGGPYNTGDTVPITITFSESVTITGTPQLTLETGTTDAIVDYTSGSPGESLTFTYTVAAGHNSNDLNYVGTDSLGGTVVSSASSTTTADLTLPATNTAQSLGGSDVIIDTIAPTFSSAATTDSNTAVVTVSEQLIGTTGSSDFLLEYDNSGFTAFTLDGATFSGDTVTLVHDSVFQHGEVIRVSYTGSTLTDAAGNALVQFTNEPVTNNVPAPPTVTSVTAPAGDYSLTEGIPITVTFSEPITVTGTPQLVVNVGGTSVPVTLDRREGDSQLVFRYTVAAGHNTADFNYAGTDSLSVTGGTIVSVDDSTPADLALPAITAPESLVNIDITIDSIAPTATITSADANSGDRIGGVSLFYTVTFSEPVTGFENSDITVTGTAAGLISGFTGSGTVYTFEVDAGNDGTAIVSISAGAVRDTAGNANTESNTHTVTFDTTEPTVTISSTTARNLLTASTTIPYTVTFSESVSGFEQSDIVLVGTAGGLSISGFTGSGASYSFNVATTSDGTVSVSIPAGAAESGIGNDSAASDTYTLTRDTVVPTAVSARTATRNTIEITMSETTFGAVTSSDFTVTDKTVSQAPTLGSIITVTVSETILSTDTLQVSYSGTGVGDIPGNTLAPFTLDVTNNLPTTPTVTSVSAADGDYRGGQSIPITVRFSESVTVSGTPQLALDIGGTSVPVDYTSGSPGTDLLFQYAVGASHNTADFNYVATNSLTLGGGTIQASDDSEPADLTLPATTAPESLAGSDVTVDTVLPVAVITSSTANDGDTTNSATISYTATFNEDVTGFDSSDITVSGSASGGSPMASNFAGSGAIYTFDVVTSSDGTVAVVVPANLITDAAGNTNLVSNTHTVTVNTAKPTVTLSSTTANDGDTTNAQSISYTATFGETVTGFVIGDITVTGTADGGILAASSFGGSGAVYTFDVDVSSDGTILVSIPADVAENGIGNGNEISGVYTVTIDTTGPTFSSAATASSTTIVITASEPLAGTTTPSDFTVHGNTVSDAVISDSTITLTVSTPIITGNVLRVSYSGNTVTDTLGNAMASFSGRTATNNVSGTVTLGTASYSDEIGGLGDPQGVSVNAGRIFIADTDNHQVKIFDLSGNPLDTIGTGAQGSDNDQFTRPAAVAANSTHMFVADTGNNRIRIFDLDGNYISQFGSSGSGSNQFLVPSGITTNSTHIFVADSANNRIQIFDLSGNHADTIGGTAGDGDNNVDFPSSVTVNSENIFVAESDNHRVHVFTHDGTHVSTIGAGTLGSANNQFDNPSGITHNSTHIFVADTNNNRVQIFTPDGTLTGTVDSRGSGNAQFNSPFNMATNSTHLFVADRSNDRIQIFELDIETSFSFGSRGTGNGQFDNPFGIAINYEQIFVVDSRNDRIQSFDRFGNYLDQFGDFGTGNGQFDEPEGITVNSNHILVTDRNNNRIQIFDLDGNYVSQFGSSGSGNNQFNGPRGITTNSTHILVSDTDNSRIQIFDLDGNYVSQFGSSGRDVGEFTSPRGIAVNSTHILVADAATHRIQTHDLSGNHVSTFGSFGSGNGQLNGPRGIAVTATNILISDLGNDRLVIFDHSGNHVNQFDAIGSSNYVTVSGDSVFATDVDLDGVTVFSLSELLATTPPRFSSAETTSANTIVITTSEPLVGTTTASEFTVSVGDTDNVVSTATSTGNTITLTVTTDIASGATITVSYTGTVLADADGNALVLFGAQPVTNNVPAIVAPTVTSVSATDGAYGVGVSVPIDVTFSESVTVTGTPQLTLETGTTDAVVNYDTGSPGNTLTFTYTVAAGHNSDDLNYVGTDSLSGGTVVATTGGVAADLTLPEITSDDSLGGSDVVIDTIAPTSASITTTSPTTIDIVASEPLTGTPNPDDFTLRTDAFVVIPITAATISDSTITITSNTQLPIGTLTLSLTGSSVTDLAGNALVFSGLPVARGTFTTVTVTSVAASGGPYKIADTVPITITFSESVTVTGTPQLTLETGTTDAVVDYTSGSPGTALLFNYVVAAGHSSADLNYIATNSLSLNSGTIVPSGATAVLTLPATTSAQSLGGSNIIIDGIAPIFSSAETTSETTIVITASESLTGTSAIVNDITVSSNTVSTATISGNTITVTVNTAITSTDTVTVELGGTSVTDLAGNALVFTSRDVTNNVVSTDLLILPVTDGIYGIGDTVTITITFSKSVTVTGTPQLVLETGATDAIVDGTVSSGTELTFAYTVEEGHNSDDLTYASTNSLTVNGGTIVDSDGATVDLTLPVPASLAALPGRIIIDGVEPTVTITSTTAADSTTSSRTISYTATFSEDVTGFDAITDITVAGTATATAAVPTGSGTTYTFVVTATTDGTVIVSIPADAAADAATNGNEASATYTVTIAPPAPTFTTFGTSGSGNGQFSTPNGIAVNATHVLVVDALNDRIQIFDHSGNYVSQFGSLGSGGGLFVDTEGITTNSTHILVTYVARDLVRIFDHSGNYISQFGSQGSGNGQFNSPGGIITNSTHILVTDALDDRIQIFDHSGNYVSQFGSTGTGNGQLDSPGEIAVTASQILVTDGLNDRIQIFDHSGNYVSQFGSTGTGNGQLDFPYGIAVTASQILVTDFFNDRIQAFDHSGNYVSQFGSTGSGNNQFEDPYGIAVHGNNVFVIDQTNNRIVVFSLSLLTPPSVSSVSATGGPYGTGDTVPITVTFSESVTITGTPQLTLETGTTDAVVDYTSGSPGAALTFTYTVAAGHNSADLNYVGTDSLDLNSGTIVATTGGAAAVLTLPATNTAQSLGGSDVVIDTTAPTFSSAETTSETTIDIVASESLTGTPAAADFTLTGNTISTVTASGSTITITVSTAITSTDTVTVALSGTSVTDLAGNAFTFTAQTVANNVSAAPTVTEVTTNAPAQGYRQGEGIPVIVRFSEPVTVTGTPQLTLDIGGTLVPVDIDRGSGTTDLVFRYVVAAGHNTDNFNYAGTGSLSLNSGTIVAATGGAAADLTLPAPSSSGLAGSGIEIDTVSPVATVTSDIPADGFTNTLPIPYTVTFTEDVTLFGSSDISVSGTAGIASFQVLNFAGSGDTYTFDLNFTPTSDGTVIVATVVNAADDLAGNTSPRSDSYTVTLDTAAPTVTVSSGTVTDNSHTNISTIPYTVTFSEPVIGFDESDIMVSGTANSGTFAVSSFVPVTGGAEYTFDMVVTSDGTVIVSIPAGTATDPAGNENPDSNTFTLTRDTTAPEFTSARTTSDTAIEIVTSEPIGGTIAPAQFTVTGKTIASAVFSGSGITLTVNEVITASDTLRVSYAGTTLTDLAGNQFPTFALDATNNVAGINVSSVTASGGPYKEGDEVEIMVMFTESVTVTGTPQLTLETGTTDAIVDYTDGSPGRVLSFNYTVAAGHNSDDLNYVDVDSLSLNSGTIAATAGGAAAILTLPPTASGDSLGGSDVIIDTTRPTVTISSTIPDGGTSPSRTVSYEVIFSEPVTGFTFIDIGLNSFATVSAVTQSGSTYAFTVTTDSDVILTMNIFAGVATDLAGNFNLPSEAYTVLVNTGSLDIVPPTVTSAGTTSANTIEITVSESLVGSTAATEFTVSVDGTTNAVTVATSAGNTITLTVTTDIAPGATITVSYSGNALADAAGNALATFATQTVANNVSPAAPTVTGVTAPAGNYRLGEGIPVFVTFSEPITVTGAPQIILDIGGTDVTVNLNRVESTTQIVFRYVVAAGHNTEDFNYAGTDSLRLNGGTIVATTGSTAADLTLPATDSSQSLANIAITIDTIVPTVALSSSTAAGSTTNTAITYTATFGEDVTGFDAASDITLSGTATATAAAPTGSGTTYTFVVTATTDGTVIASIPANAGADAAGNGNTVSATYTVTVDQTAPTFSSAGTASETTIVITASEPLTGTPNAADFTLTGNTISSVAASGSTITITVGTEITSTDTITVALGGTSVTDLAGNALTFTTQTVTNNVSPPFQAITFGSDGVANGEFRNPVGVAANSTHVLVADTVRHNVQIFDLDGNYVSQFGSNGRNDGQFDAPRGVAINSTHILVADFGNRVQTFDHSGNHVYSYGDFIASDNTSDGELLTPQGITTNSTHVLVADRGNNIVQVFDHSGNYVSQLGHDTFGSADGQFSGPRDIAVTDTNIFVADTVNDRIQIFDLAGNYVSQFGSSGSGNGEFDDPTGIALTATHILVTDEDNHRIQTFDHSGNYVNQFGSEGTGDNQFDRPAGITINGDIVFVADTRNDRVHKLSLFSITGVTGVAPTVTISSTVAADSATNSRTITYTATFSSDVTEFDAISDIALSGTATATAAAPTGSGTTYTFVVTATTDGTVIVSIPADAAIDADSIGNTASATYTVTIDTVAPTFSSAATASSTTIDVIASEPLAGTPAIGDFAIPGNTVSAATISGSTITITVNTAITSTDTVTVALSGTSVTDLAGNALTFAAQSVTNNISAPPTVTSVTAPSGDYMLNEGIPVTVTFSEPITVTGTPQLTLNIGGTSIPVDLDRSTSTTTVFRYVVAAGHNTDNFNYVGTDSLSLNGGTIAATTGGAAADLTLPPITSVPPLVDFVDVIVDTTAPTVAISSAIADNDGTTNTRTISYTATFSETTTNFVLGDITVTGTADSSSPTASNFAGSGTTYTFDVVTTTDGTVVVSIPASSATDAAGNQNTISNTYTVTIDATALTVSISSTTAADSATNTQTISYTATFSGTVTDFVIGDITVTGTADSSSPTASNFAGSGTTYTFDVVTTSDGTVIVSIPAGVATEGSDTNMASNTYTVTIDTVQPTVTISSSVPNGGTSTSRTVLYDIVFSEPVTGFTNTNILANTLASVSITGSGTTYTLSVTTSSDLTFEFSVIPGGTIMDAAGNLSVASGAYSVTINTGSLDTEAPTFVSAITTSATTIEITASENLSGSIGSADATVSGNTVSAASLLTGNIRLTVDTPIVGGDTITVSYTGTSVTDAALNPLVMFTDQPVTNDLQTPPRVTSVTSTGGSYNATEIIPITVTFDESVTVTGTPQLALETGTTDGVADYTSGSPGAALTFTYTVAAGHNSADLNYVDTDSLTLNGGTILATDDSLAAVLTLPDLTSASSLLNSNVVIDTVSPTIIRSIATGTGIVEVTTSEALAESSITPTSVTMTVGGTAATITDRSLVAGNNIVITTSNTLSSTDVIIVTLTAVTDLAGNTLTATDTLSDDEKSLLGTDNMVSIIDTDNVFVIQETIPTGSTLADETSLSVNATLDLSNILAASDNPNADAIIPAAFSITRPGITIELQATTGVSGLPDSNQILLSELARTAVLPQSANVDFAVEIGSPDLDITLSNPARITFSGLSGSTPYYVNAAGVTTLITTTCGDDSVGSLGITTGECRIVSGNDLIIWTYHFTTFGAFTVPPPPEPEPPRPTPTPAPTPEPRRTGGGGGNSGLPPDSRVCGASLCSELETPPPQRIDTNSNGTRSNPDTEQDRDSPSLINPIPETDPEPAPDRDPPSILDTDPEPEMDPEPLEPEMDPEPLEPEMDPEPALKMDPEPLEPEMDPEPLEPEMDPEPLEPEMDPEPVEPRMSPEPTSGERNIFESIITWFGSLFG